MIFKRSIISISYFNVYVEKVCSSRIKAGEGRETQKIFVHLSEMIYSHLSFQYKKWQTLSTLNFPFPVLPPKPKCPCFYSVSRSLQIRPRQYHFLKQTDLHNTFHTQFKCTPTNLFTYLYTSPKGRK